MITKFDLAQLKELQIIALNMSEDPCFLSGSNPKSAVAALLITTSGQKYYGANRRVVSNEIEVNSNNKSWYIEHAERDVLYSCVTNGIDTRGSTLYVTKYPCAECARAIVVFGVSRVVISENYDLNSKWYESQVAAETIFNNNNVVVEIAK